MQTIGDNYYQHPYQQQWSKLYPGKQFPTPEKYPAMFPKGAQTAQQIEYINPLFPDCSAKTCPKGLVDYQCQYEHGCYLKLAELGVDLLITLVVVTIAVGVVGKLMSLLCGICDSVVWITNMVSCMGRCLGCLSFGMLDQDRVVQVRIEGPETRNNTQRHKKIQNKLTRLDIEVNLQELKKQQIDKIGDILSDYEIGSEKKSETSQQQS